MAGQRSKRRSRKSRGPASAAPRPAPAPRREQHARHEPGARSRATGPAGRLGVVGQRPPGPFGGLPVSEIAIAIGLIGVAVGYVGRNATAMIVGAVVCGLGVTEVTAREHFSGFRSHATLLAAIPAVIVETLLVVVFGEPSDRKLLLVPVIPVFAVCFWLLRRNFAAARQARVARPPAP